MHLQTHTQVNRGLISKYGDFGDTDSQLDIFIHANAGPRRIKLKLLAESGDERATKVMALQENSAAFFASAQIGVNAVAILGGIVGESALRPYFLGVVSDVYQGAWLDNIAFGLAFSVVTFLFILFADLMPKRMAMFAPEKIALKAIKPRSSH